MQVTEIVSKIKTKSELDCKARDIVTIEEGDEDNNATLDKFWKILSGDTDAKIKGWSKLRTVGKCSASQPQLYAVWLVLSF